MKNYKPCYNCGGVGSTHEHIIPRFLLSYSEHGLTIPCCEKCRNELKWLDDYGADYFRFIRSQNSIEEWEKWHKQAIIQNGSPKSLRIFGEDIVINEDLLMRFVHKMCVCIAYHLYGRLNNTFRLNIFTNFSKLGGYSQYNGPDDKSLTEEQTNKILRGRVNFYAFLKQLVNPYCVSFYKIKNAEVLSTTQQIVQGARWFNVVLYDSYEILCAVVDNITPEFAQARNMLISSLPVRIELGELNQLREEIEQTEKGDSISAAMAISPISKESKNLRKNELLSLGVSINEIEAFENSLYDSMENKGGKEKFRKMLIDAYKGKYDTFLKK